MNDLISRSEALKYIPPEEPISRMVIAQLPTIEAIPVEWVEEQMRKCVPHSITWLCLKALLVAWKENENEHEID